MSERQPEEFNTTMNDKPVDIRPKVVPSQHGSVHADQIMVAIDWSTKTATLTLLSMHPQPQIGSEGWVLAEVDYEVVGEIKVPLPSMDSLMIYYLQQISNGLDILPLIQKHLAEHPRQRPYRVSYGPTQIREEARR
jgi:hypothetical protein